MTDFSNKAQLIVYNLNTLTTTDLRPHGTANKPNLALLPLPPQRQISPPSSQRPSTNHNLRRQYPPPQPLEIPLPHHSWPNPPLPPSRAQPSFPP